MITASVLRHGPTHYTNVFPDLSEEHLSLLDATAWDIMQNFQGKIPTFISSPTPRTIASAIRIAQAYGMNLEQEDIPQDPLIGPLHRVEHAIDFLREKIAHLEHNVDPLVRHNILDYTYMEDPAFEDGILCESRSSAKARFFQFLSTIREIGSHDQHVIATTHLDVAGPAIQEWFDERGANFSPAEVVHFWFLENSHLKIRFRNKERVIQI